MDVIYVVTKQGVYIHDVHGPICGLGAAKTAAAGLAATDQDGHHEWQVRALTPLGLGPRLLGYTQASEKEHRWPGATIVTRSPLARESYYAEPESESGEA